MSFIVLTGAIALLLLSLLLEEAALWFGRRALDADRNEDEEAVAQHMARAARQGRLLGRFLMALGFGILAADVVRSRSGTAVSTLVVAGFLWTVGSAGLSGVHWGSPLALVGRALLRPVEWLGAALRWFLLAWGRLPGLGSPVASLERVREVKIERQWLRARPHEEEEDRMLATLHEFGESRVEDVMVPREEMVAVSAQATVEEAVVVVGEEGYSRYPVYRDSMDSVVGVLHVFDLLGAPSGERAGALAHAPFLTNDTKPVGTLLRELQETYNQMAVVVDEYGGTAGIVTVEDLLEELVGEIEDEHDEERSRFRSLEPGVYWVDGMVRVDELNEALELDLEEGEYDTLAGLVLERLERIPRAGERVRASGVWLEVVAAEPHRIGALRMTVIKKDDGDGSDRGEEKER
jgi:CBS domain containing-hemolysin-like protein